MEEIKLIIFGEYLTIETNTMNFTTNSFEKLEIKKEDNGKPIILVESRQQ